MTERRQLPAHPRLGRHVNHDPRSRGFAFDTSGLDVASVVHERRAPIFDQGDTRACTGNAALGCLGTGPLYDTVAGEFTPAGEPDWDEATALDVYALATQLDPWPGTYPGQDTGSDGLSAAKALKQRGWISGYRHTFSVAEDLKALQVTPLICGTNWYESMFDPDSDAVVHVDTRSGLAGGHEWVLRGYDAARRRLLCDNSWGAGWGAAGSFYLGLADYATLRAADGDATVFVARTDPPPKPAPTVDADLDRLVEGTRGFLAGRWPCSGAGAGRRALRAYLTAKGRG